MFVCALFSESVQTPTTQTARRVRLAARWAKLCQRVFSHYSRSLSGWTFTAAVAEKKKKEKKKLFSRQTRGSVSLKAFLKWTSFNGNSAEDVCIQRVMLDVSSFDRKDTSMWVWAVKTSRPLQLESGSSTRARLYPTGRSTLEQISWNEVWARLWFSQLSVKYVFKINEVIFSFLFIAWGLWFMWRLNPLSDQLFRWAVCVLHAC